MNRNELRARAAELGISATGTNDALRERIAAEEARLRRSRKDMAYTARGNKAEVFAAAAKSAGYSVETKTNRQTGGTFVYAVKGERRVTVAWTKAGAWDYAHTRETKTGAKGRKIRNLALALKVL